MLASSWRIIAAWGPAGEWDIAEAEPTRLVKGRVAAVTAMASSWEIVVACGGAGGDDTAEAKPVGLAAAGEQGTPMEEPACACARGSSAV